MIEIKSEVFFSLRVLPSFLQEDALSIFIFRFSCQYAIDGEKLFICLV